MPGSALSFAGAVSPEPDGGMRPARQRASCAAASAARRAQLAISSLRSAKSASSAASRSSAAVNSSSASPTPSRSAATRCAILPGVSPSASRSLRIAGPMPVAASGRAATSRAPRARGDFGVPCELRELPGRELLSEKQRRGVRELMRLVEDQRVAGGQQLGEPLVAQHDVGEEQVMVDDDDVGLERGLARLEDEAIGVERAICAEAVVARRRDERPDRRVFRDVGQRAAIAGFRRARERDDPGKVPRILARGQPAVGGGALQMMVADIVRAALEQRERDRELQRIANERQVALEQLVLQRLGAGGDDHLAAVEQRGNEIREGLARAGAGFGDQCGPRC